MRVNSGGVGIEYDVTGEGRPVVLLHGFPDTAQVWRHQTRALADAGFRVITPDTRGFGRSDKPLAVEAYGMRSLIGDVLAVMADAGEERVHVVGHDWGASLAWALATFLPERVDHLAALSVGHAAAFRAAGLAQLQRSWYMLLFQFEGVAESWLSDREWANLRAWSNHPDIDAVVAALEPRDALTAALGVYRANVPPETLVAPPLEQPQVQAPTLGVWSSGDMALTEAQMVDSAAYVDGPWRYERLEGPGHWLQLEARDAVTSLLLDFLPV